MPHVPNKIILNGPDFDADSFSMQQALVGAGRLGDEIIALGESLNPNSGGIIGNHLLEEDANRHLVEQESICADLHKALADCVSRQRALNDKRRKWLDAAIRKLP